MGHPIAIYLGVSVRQPVMTPRSAALPLAPNPRSCHAKARFCRGCAESAIATLSKPDVANGIADKASVCEPKASRKQNCIVDSSVGTLSESDINIVSSAWSSNFEMMTLC